MSIISESKLVRNTLPAWLEEDMRALGRNREESSISQLHLYVPPYVCLLGPIRIMCYVTIVLICLHGPHYNGIVVRQHTRSKHMRAHKITAQARIIDCSICTHINV